MNAVCRVLTGLTAIALCAGCMTRAKPARAYAYGQAEHALALPPAMLDAEAGEGLLRLHALSAAPDEPPAGDDAALERMRIWTATLHVQVWNVSNAVNTAIAIAEAQGGFVERKSDRGEHSSHLTLRIPAHRLAASVSSLASLGTVTYQSLQGEDVTEQVADLEARLKNRIALRDRLRQLLEKAESVQDVLAIETQLNRVQSDIDSMEGRMKAIRGQVDFAKVTLDLGRKPILGPMGYLVKGLWWSIEKLFVIRN